MVEKIHGYYTYSNCCSYGVILSDCGESAKLVMNNEDCDVTDWLVIEHIFDEEEEEWMPVIDPTGYNIPLNLVMRAN
jgi:hypothetical protein